MKKWYTVLMKKVVLLAVNAKYVHSSLSVWFLAAGIAHNACLRYDVVVAESTINRPINEIAGQVAAHEPDIVGISAYIWNAQMLPELIAALRGRLPCAVFVLGGPEAAYNEDFWLERGADYVLRGEGEQRLPMLLDALSGGVVSARDVGGLKLQPQAPLNPYSSSYFNALDGRIAYIETSRGCPFRCAFCLSAGSGVRFFPIDAAKEQIRKLAGSGTKTVKFVDRTFNCDRERAYELFEFILNLEAHCCFHFEVAADLFDEKTLTLLAAAPPGRIQLEAGIQSFFLPALEASARQTDIEKAERSIRALVLGQNIHIHVDLIAGLPNETLSEFQNSFDRAFALGAHTLQLGFLKLIHGSLLREQSGALGISFSDFPPYEIISSPWLSAEDLHVLKSAENALRRTYNKSRFLSSLEYVLSATHLSPFSLFRMLGEAAPNSGIPLDAYAMLLFDCFSGLPGVKMDMLLDCMTCDWLGMVKGKNMPLFLKMQDKRRKQIASAAAKRLGHAVSVGETAVLSCGSSVFVDIKDRDPVNGLYRVFRS